MFPFFTRNNQIYSRLGNSKHFAQFGLAIVATLVQFLYFHYLLSSQFTGRVLWAKISVPWIAVHVMLWASKILTPALFLLILVVIGPCTKKQMGRVDARRIIASMANTQAFSDRAIFKSVRNAMRPYTVQHPVTKIIFGRLPLPTFIWASLFDFRPKPLLKRGDFAAASHINLRTCWATKFSFIFSLSNKRGLTNGANKSNFRHTVPPIRYSRAPRCDQHRGGFLCSNFGYIIPNFGFLINKSGDCYA